MSGAVKIRLQEVIDDNQTSFAKVSKQELQVCCDVFDNLIVKRNALIHAHPSTDTDGAQILAYQTDTSRRLPDMKWPKEEVEKIISEIDVAACDVGGVLDKVR